MRSATSSRSSSPSRSSRSTTTGSQRSAASSTSCRGCCATTAYGTLSRRDRKSRHLAAARHLQEAWGDEAPELAEVLAAHFLDAADADPDAADAPQIRAMACETLAEAGERALSLALGPEAQRAFEHAAELAADDGDPRDAARQGRAAQPA